MKGQISRHKWNKGYFVLTEHHQICPHCGVKRTKTGVALFYYYKNGTRLTSKPKCITRKITEDESIVN